MGQYVDLIGNAINVDHLSGAFMVKVTDGKGRKEKVSFSVTLVMDNGERFHIYTDDDEAVVKQKHDEVKATLLAVERRLYRLE